MTHAPLLAALAIAALTTASVSASEVGTPIPAQLDHRGLVTIEGVLRGNSEGTWGASNLIIKPIGGWAAQDYCLANIVLGQGSVTADFKTTPAIAMVETSSEGKDAQGRKTLKVSYKLTPKDGGTATYEKVYVFLPLASKDFAGGTVTLADGKTVALPQEPKDEVVVPKAQGGLTVAGGGKRLRVSADKLALSVRDLRPKSSTFQIWLEYPEIKDVKTMEFSFEVGAESIK